MGRVVLLVEPNDSRRTQLRREFTRANHPVYEVSDSVDAMVAIGRAEFGALVASEGRRQLSLRGLCHLARRRHPGISIFVLGNPGSEAELRDKLGVDVQVISSTAHPREIVDTVYAATSRVPAPFDLPAVTEVLSRDHLPISVDYDTDSGPQVASAGPSSSGERPAAGAADVSDLASLARADTLQTALGSSLLGEFAEPTLLDPSDAENSATDGMYLDDLDEDEATVLDVERPTFDGIGMASVAQTDDGPRTTSDPPAASGPDTDNEYSDTERVAPAPGGPQPPLFEGDLTAGGGPALLMGVFAQHVTGRLEIDGGTAAGTIFFYDGEPVAARHPLGDAGLLARLVARSVLRSEVEAPGAPEGLLLSALVAEGRLRGQDLHEFLREFVRDRVLELINSEEGSYRFVEDTAFLLTTPLLKLNPFGLIVETMRRKTPGAEILERSRATVSRWLEPTPALAIAAPRLKPFTRDVDMAEALGTGARVSELLHRSGIDGLHGTLIVLSLVEAHLARFAPEAPTAVSIPALVELDPSPTVKVKALPDSALSDSDLSQDEQDAREEIFALYMRLKPLMRPTHVLGVSLTANKQEIEAAYAQRMQDLDPGRIPSGSARELLTSRVNELRAKVTRAFEALKVQHDMVTKKVRATEEDPDGGGGSNPW